MPRKPKAPTGDGIARTNLTLPAIVRRMAIVRIGETGEMLTGFIARLIREDWTRLKRREDDPRLGPQKEQGQ